MELNPIAFEKASPLCVGPSRRFFMAELRMTRLRNPDCYLGDLVEGERFPSTKRVLKRYGCVSIVCAIRQAAIKCCRIAY